MYVCQSLQYDNSLRKKHACQIIFRLSRTVTRDTYDGIPIGKNRISVAMFHLYSSLILFVCFYFYYSYQLPEVIESTMSTSASIPTSIQDCTDNSQVNRNALDIVPKIPTSTTLPDLKSSNTKPLVNASIRLPIECTTLPAGGQDLLHRLLEFNPDRRIRSMFSLQRIAFFMGFNFDDAKKKKVNS